MKERGFHKGHHKLGGRKSGTQNRFTRAAKELYQLGFEGAGGINGLIKWIKRSNSNRTEFYKLHARLIPLSVRENEDERIDEVIVTFVQSGEHLEQLRQREKSRVEIGENPNDLMMVERNKYEKQTTHTQTAVIH